MKIKVWMGITLASLMVAGTVLLSGVEVNTKAGVVDPPVPMGSPTAVQVDPPVPMGIVAG